MSNETIDLLLALLSGLTISPLSPDAPRDLEKIRKAAEELEKARIK